MDAKQIIAGLQSGLKSVEMLAPLLGVNPAIGSVLSVASALTGVASNVLDRIEEGKIVAESNDIDTIRKMVGELAAINDMLSKKIAES